MFCGKALLPFGSHDSPPVQRIAAESGHFVIVYPFTGIICVYIYIYIYIYTYIIYVYIYIVIDI